MLGPGFIAREFLYYIIYWYFCFSLVDFVKHLNIGITDRVFPVNGWDYTANVISNTAVREVFAVYDDFGVTKRLDDGMRSECAF